MVLKIFSATWCGPCKKLKKILLDNNIPHEIIDIDENPEAVKQYKIKSVPVAIFEENGQIIEEISGVYPPQKYSEILLNKKDSTHIAA